MNKLERYKMVDIAESGFGENEYDVLITATSSEDRSVALSNEMKRQHVHVKRLIALDYYGNEANIQYLIQKDWAELTEECKVVGASVMMGQSAIAEIQEYICKSPAHSKIAIDITCIPIPSFFILLKLFSLNLRCITVFYTEPLSYVMANGLFESYYSYLGPVNTSEVLGFTGISANGQQSERTLLCLLGFDNDLLPSVIQDAGPNKIIAINGFPSYHPKFKDISLTNNEKVLNGANYADILERSEDYSHYYYAEASNPFDTYNVLSRICEQHPDDCIDIVPLGSKPMALGACLYAIRHSNIRVVFPFAEGKAHNSTSQSKHIWMYKIDI